MNLWWGESIGKTFPMGEMSNFGPVRIDSLHPPVEKTLLHPLPSPPSP